MRRGEAEDGCSLAVHAALLRASIHVLIGLDDQRAYKGHHQHELGAHCEKLVLVVTIRAPRQGEHQNGHVDHEPDEDAYEGAGLLDEQHPAGQEGTTCQLDELPVEALWMVVAVKKGRRSNEGAGGAVENRPPRRQQKHGVQHQHALSRNGARARDQQITVICLLLVGVRAQDRHTIGHATISTMAIFTALACASLS